MTIRVEPLLNLARVESGIPNVFFTMKVMKAVASSSRSDCPGIAVLPCCAGFYEGVLRLSPLRETSFPR